MKATILLLVLLSAIALAADAAAMPQSTAGRKPQVTAYGAESITIPQMLSYQGRLTDTTGVPVPNGNYPMMFLLYTSPTGGSAFWSENQSVMTKDGLFSVLLGSATPVGSMPDAGAVYLAMTVSGGPELTPRIRIASAAYAFLSARAASADLLQGKDTTGFVRSGQANSVTSAMVTDATIAAVDLGQMGAAAGQVMKWNGSTWAPRNDSVGQSGGGTVTSVSQATGIVCSPNPITTTGTVRLDTTYGDGRYLKNQFGTNQPASWRITGQGRCSTATASGVALYGTNTSATGWAVRGAGTNYPGLSGVSASINYGSIEGANNATSAGGFGVSGFGTAATGVYGQSTTNAGVMGFSTSNNGVYGTTTSGTGVRGNSSSGAGVHGSTTSGNGVYGSSSSGAGVFGTSDSSHGVYGEADISNTAGVFGYSSVTGSGTGLGVLGKSPSYWGVEGYRYGSEPGTGYSYYQTRGGVHGLIDYGDSFAFGMAGYTQGYAKRTGGVLGAKYDAPTWGALGYKNSSSTWYAGYGTAGWNSGSGLGSHAATGIGCGYGGGLMGGWLKGKHYGATVSGDRYALYAKGNSYTSGYSAEMQNTGGKREAVYGTTSTNVDIYTSGVAEMKGGKAIVSFPASFAATVSKDVPIVVTATPMGPAAIYLSSSTNRGFTVEAVDAKASVKFSWIAVGRRAGYEQNPEVPAELVRTDFDSKMDGVMFNENDLHHSAQPVWFDGTQLRFDNPPEEARPPKPAQPASVRPNPPPAEPSSAALPPAPLQPSGDER